LGWVGLNFFTNVSTGQFLTLPTKNPAQLVELVVSRVGPPTRMVTHIMLGFAMLGYFILTKHISGLANGNLASTPNGWG